MKAQAKNHDSYHTTCEWDRPPAWDLLQAQVDSGFALLFENKEQAEGYLSDRTHPAPLGCVSKQKDDGTWKHRLIQDLRANHVNAAVRLPERQVLPRGIDHGIDLAIMAENLAENEVLVTMILDFKDAFMSIPLAKEEMRFNCAYAEFDLKRSREPLYENEPTKGAFVVWRVLGFGGRPNPLVFSRVASLASRTAQALLGPSLSGDRLEEHRALARGRLQLYVDDPILTCAGTISQVSTSLDLVLLWWLILGIPLSWSKGAVIQGQEKHRWIGIDYQVVDNGALMTLPDKFLEDLAKLIEPLCHSTGTIALTELDGIIGKAARVAHVVPHARPFVAGLWGALSAVQRLGRDGVREAPPGRAACRRFCYAAAWVKALITADESSPLKLERLVSARQLQEQPTSGWSIEFDASIYGGGAVLKDENNKVTEYFAVVWDGFEAPHLEIWIHDSAHQTFWEFATLLICLVTWGHYFTDSVVKILGDNTGSLQNALTFKGRGPLTAIAR
jgi:hypothetical protein